VSCPDARHAVIGNRIVEPPMSTETLDNRPETPAKPAAARSDGRGPAPIYIVCSPSRRVGKTLLARLVNDHYLADGRSVAAFDLADESPRLTDFVSGREIAIGDMSGQMSFFDDLIARNDVPKVIDVGYREFANFFAIVHKIGLFEEARRRCIEPLILFMIDPDQKAERAYAMLRRSFAGFSLLPVRNQMIARGLPYGVTFRHASTLAVSIEIPELRPPLRSRIERERFSFATVAAQPPSSAQPTRRDDELRSWFRRLRVQFREIELGLISEQILAALR
jgi:hypothetical protein